MSKEKLITGITVAEQISKAKTILNSQVIPREELFQVRINQKRASQSKKSSVKINA